MSIFSASSFVSIDDDLKADSPGKETDLSNLAQSQLREPISRSLAQPLSEETDLSYVAHSPSSGSAYSNLEETDLPNLCIANSDLPKTDLPADTEPSITNPADLDEPIRPGPAEPKILGPTERTDQDLSYDDFPPNDFEEDFHLATNPSISATPETPTEEEAKLVLPVEGLLERMNAIANIINGKESELHRKDTERRGLAMDWKATKLRLADDIGVATIERARPVMDLYIERLAAQEAVNAATSEYCEAASECDTTRAALSTADSQETQQVLMDNLVAQSNTKEVLEKLSLEKTNEFNSIQTQINELKPQIGARIIDRAWPWFEAYAKTKANSERLGKEINVIRLDISKLKNEYKTLMNQLEDISTQVHLLRTAHGHD